MAQHNVFPIFKLPEGAKTIGTMWFFKEKVGIRGGGVYLKHHARLCAQGTYAPTGLKEETKGPVSVAAEDNLEIHKMDAIAGFPTGVPKCVSFCYEYLMDFT